MTEANIQDDFKIYQSNGMLNVQSEIESNYTIQIFNTSGQLISTNNSSNRNTQVYVDDLQTGFYIINLEDGVSRFSKKLFIKN